MVAILEHALECIFREAQYKSNGNDHMEVYTNIKIYNCCNYVTGIFLSKKLGSTKYQNHTHKQAR
jgi:hypothetical protein